MRISGNLLGEEVFEKVSTITHEIMAKNLKHETSYIQSGLSKKIKSKIKSFLKQVEVYRIAQKQIKQSNSVLATAAILDAKKDLIYKDFFELQNLINLSQGQKVVVTYVDIGEDGQREIRIIDNDISHLGTEMGMYRNNPYYKLSYEVNSAYRILKNELSEEQNQGLQLTAAEVERRYTKYKKRVLWRPQGSDWKGYYFPTKGPINEAYASFYIKNIEFSGYMEDQIDKFILDNECGAITADNFSGFMIGDYSQDGIQYAIKGKFGGAQGWIQVANKLQTVVDNDFSESAWQNFIEFFTKRPEMKSQIKELSIRKIKNTSKELEKELDFLKKI